MIFSFPQICGLLPSCEKVNALAGQSQLQNYDNIPKANPKIDTIRRCAAVLYVNPEWLEGYNVEKDPKPVQLSPLENDLILSFRSCGAADKYAIIEYVKNKGAK